MVVTGFFVLCQHSVNHQSQDGAQVQLILKSRGMDGWMNGVLGHFYALSRLNWAGDNLG